MKPLIGISCCTKLFGTFGMPNHAASDTYVRATDQLVGGVPVLVPANGAAADVETLLSRLDGIILTGSRSNVQPACTTDRRTPRALRKTPSATRRTLPLIRAAIAQGVPVLAICRGLAGTERGAGRQPAPAVAGPARPDRPFNPDAAEPARAHRQGARGPRGSGKLAAPRRRQRARSR